MTLTKELLREKIGKKPFLADEHALIAILNYESGIPAFDKYLDGKTVKQINGVIHLIKYPKGFLIKIAKLFSSFPFGLEYTAIKRTLLSEKPGTSNLIFDTTENEQIIFSLKASQISEVKHFLNKIHLKYDFETSLATVKSKTEKSTAFNSKYRKK